MRGDLAGIRSAAGLITAAMAALAVGVAGCGSSGTAAGKSAHSAAPGAASTSIAALPTGSTSQAADNSRGAGELAKSRMRVLTRLSKAELCGMTPGEPAKLLGAPTDPPVYASAGGLGNTCQWVRKGATASGTTELYVGISSVLSWTGAQAVDHKLLRTTAATVSGHPALAAAPQGNVTWGQVDVALGGADDPVAEFRAPTLARAMALANALSPRLVAMG
jgi:hypothetical protein